MIKKIVSLGLAGILSAVNISSLAQETRANKNLNSSIDSRLDQLFDSEQFKDTDIPKCPRPYIFPEDKKPEGIKLNEESIRYSICITNKYVLLQFATPKITPVFYHTSISKFSETDRVLLKRDYTANNECRNNNGTPFYMKVSARNAIIK